MRDLAKTVGIAIRLLKVLVELMLAERDGRSTAKCNMPYSDWVFQSLNRIWNIVSSRDRFYDSSVLPSRSLGTYLKTIRRFFDYCIDHGDSLLATLFQFMAQVTATAIIVVPLPLSAAVENALCLNLLEIVSPSPPSCVLQSNFKDLLNPSIAEVVKDEVRFSAFGTDLQVLFLYGLYRCSS